LQTYKPSIELLRQALGNDIQTCQAELIKVALGWSRVYRVTLNHQGHPKRDSVVVKVIDPNGSSSTIEAERELRFYQTIHPELCIPKPHVYFSNTDEETGNHVIVMEDLALSHRIPAHPYQWTRDELHSVLQAYARLHSNIPHTLDHPWLAPRHESQLIFEKIPEQAAVVQNSGIWGDLPHFSDLIDFARESCQQYVNEKPALLHGDTTPTNAALPKDIDVGSATLIDWQDAGIGMPEFDLAYLDLQPFDSARLIPRPELLDIYWHYRTEIDSSIPSPNERRNRQLHADVVTALWLVASASRVTLQPFPEGSYPHKHWSSQYGIVYNRLKELLQEIKQ
jgi:aminoglycoside phosphotransferase (APT) family kinase protein